MDNGDRPQTLRQARVAAGLKQRDIAERAGCSVPLVSMVENGYMVSLERREAMAQAVGASAGSFWEC